MAETASILEKFPVGAVKSVAPLKSGLIHATYFVAADGGDYILQRVSEVFGDAVFEDLENVTSHLKSKGLATFSLIHTKAGERFYRDPEGGRWRLVTALPGAPLGRAPSAEEARDAARLVGAFHEALTDYPHDIRHRIPGFHDTRAYLARLKELDASESASEKYAKLHPLAGEVIQGLDAIPGRIYGLPVRILHGDLKFENVLFNEAGKALAVIDLDTVGAYPLTTELGDMLRSWCNAGGTFSPDLWDAALEGYKSTASFITSEEWNAVPDGVAHIMLELAARFIIDAYEERYFAHDPARYPSLYGQNLAAAALQTALYRNFMGKRSVLRMP